MVLVIPPLCIKSQHPYPCNHRALKSGPWGGPHQTLQDVMVLITACENTFLAVKVHTNAQASQIY